MHTFDNEFIDNLVASAKSSRRLRAHYNVHKYYSEPVQRLFICLCYGTFIPPHCHQRDYQWEYFQVLSGCVKLIIFDKDGLITHVEYLGDEQDSFAIQIPTRTYHTLVCCSENAVLLEIKQGPFDENNAKFIPDWSCEECGCDALVESKRLENLVVGERYRIDN